MSLDSSHPNEKGPVLHYFTSYSSKVGTMTFVTIIVVLVRSRENFLAIFESVNICLHRRVKWSVTPNGKLCSTTKFVNRVSLRITSSVSTFTVKSSSQELWCSAISAAGCFSLWLNTSSNHSCFRDPLCKRHARYLVDFYISLGNRPSIYLDTCMYIFVSSLLVPSSFLPWSIIASAVLSGDSLLNPKQNWLNRRRRKTSAMLRYFKQSPKVILTEEKKKREPIFPIQCINVWGT